MISRRAGIISFDPIRAPMNVIVDRFYSLTINRIFKMDG